MPFYPKIHDNLKSPLYLPICSQSVFFFQYTILMVTKTFFKFSGKRKIPTLQWGCSCSVRVKCLSMSRVLENSSFVPPKYHNCGTLLGIAISLFGIIPFIVQQTNTLSLQGSFRREVKQDS